MADKINKLTPIGNMDKDSDVRYVGKREDRQGDTINNRNTQIAGDDGASSGDTTPTLGCELAFDLGEVNAQNKKYTITVDGDATKSHAIRFLSTKRDVNITSGTGSAGEIEFNGTIASLQVAFLASTLPAVFLFTVNGNVATFELIPYNYYQWYLQGSGDDDVEITCTQEAIPTDLAGELKDIGDRDILSDLFIMSTSQDNLPEVTDLHVNGIGPLSGGQLVGPLTSLSFTTEHNLIQGQWIRITNSNATWLSGVFLVQNVTSLTGIEIVTDTAWGVTHPTFVIGQESVTINPYGIGEIGVAQKNDNTDSWTYTRLLRSVELNFVSKKYTDITGDKDIDKVSIYYENDHTPSGVFYYYGEYSNDGALAHNNSENFYSYGNIAYAISATQRKPPIRIDFDSQDQSGGNVPSGNIRYFVLLEDHFGNWTFPSDLSNIVITYSEESSGESLGDEASVLNTNKANNLTISGINTQVYERLRLGYVLSIEGAVSAYIMDESDITGSSTTIKHDGFCGEELYDIGLIGANFYSGYDFAKSNNIIDKRLVRSNLRKKELSDLSAWAATFKHRIKEEFIQCSSYASDANEFQDPENGFYKSGYMFNESYRYSVRGRFIDTGEFTPWFWVDDIKIDPFATNTYNPNDNRRDQTGSDIVTNFDLTKNLGGPFPTSKWVKIPYVEFFDVDTNHLVDGQPISAIIDSIEFGRAEVVPEVLCTGLATMSVVFQGLRGIFYNNLGGNQPFTSDDGERAACFPFNQLENQGDYFMGYLIQVPSTDDIAETRYEYPFVYGPPYMGSNTINGAYPDVGADNTTPIYDYPNTTDTFFGDPVLIQSDPAVNPFTPWKSDRTMLSIYSPDIIFRNKEDISGYSLLDFGEMFLGTDDPFYNRTNANKGAMFSQYSKYFPENLGQTFQIYNVDDWKALEAGEKDFITTGKSFSKGFGIAHRGLPSQDMVAVEMSHKNVASPVVHIDNQGLGVTPQGKNADYGVRYIQMYKPLTNKYCSKESTTYYTTNSIYDLKDIQTQSGVIGKGVFNVFGGDTFTQLTYLKGRYIDKSALIDSGLTEWSEANFGPLQSAGFGGGFKFYSQNRVNSQMRNDNEDQITYLADGTEPVHPWLEEFEGKIDLLSYSDKYTPDFLYTQIGQPSFELVSKDKTDFPQRIEYSSRKTYSAEQDDYLDRPVLNIHDLNLTFGEIHHHEDILGELFSIQTRKFSILAFNARGQLETSANSVDVILKSGDVFTTDGKTLSSYGTDHKWSAIKGFNPQGKDVAYWLNVENGVMMRFGADGTKVISSRGLKAFMANYSKWLKNKHEHAYDEGIRGVWDNRRNEAIWTSTAWREHPQWANSGLIQIQVLEGTVVRNDNAPSDTYEGFPRFFRCILGHTASSIAEPAVGVDWETYWEQIPYTDYNHYSIFTVCFNEMTNGFRCFYGHIPKTYLKWQNTFLSSHPIHRNLIFEHRKGLPTTWYGAPNYKGGAIAPKVEDAEFEMVVNELPEQSVRGVAVEFLTDRAPDRVEYRTKRQYTFDEEEQFEARDDGFFAPIRNDATATGNPDSDDGMLSGSYLRVKFTIFGGTYNLLHSIVVKVRDRIRRINT